MALDSKWDQTTYTAPTLRSLSNQTFDTDMEKLGMVDIAPELLEEMKRGSNAAGTRTATSQWERHQETGSKRSEVEDNNRSWEEAAWEEINTTQRRTIGCIPNAERRTRTRQQDKLRDQQRASRWRNKYPTQPRVQQNLAHFKKGAAECQRALTRTLRKMSPEHPIFAETIYTKNAMETGSFGSNQSEELKRMYWETRANSFRLRACINEVEQSTLMSKQQTGTPPPSGSTAPPKPKSQRARRDPGVGRCRDRSPQQVRHQGCWWRT
jgi:hypothetical protein